MSAAREIRAAARALRCGHSWSVRNVAPPGPCDICGIPWSEAPIVAAHVAAPLATWLESWDVGPFSEHGAMPSDLEDALKIARAINGGES